MDYQNYLAEQARLYERGFYDIQSRRLEWADLSKRAHTIFQKIRDQADSQKFFDCLYIYDHTKFVGENITNQHYICLYMGTHANGIINIKKEDNRTSQELSHERGGALLLSQGPQGEVLFIIYPCSSNEFKINHGNLVWNIYRNPARVSDKAIERAVKMFFRYSYISSFIGEISFIDRVRIGWIKMRVNFDIFIAGKILVKVVEKFTGLGSDIVTMKEH